ncbi:MAG: trypsin-like serine protease [Tepidisphaeraceae bacterium]|jgi:hypothetical protein
MSANRRGGKICINRRIGALAGATAVAAVWTYTSRAATIRDDTSDSNYTSLGAESQYAASGFVYVNIGGNEVIEASGTLIAPDWVLTAAHVVTANTSGTPSYSPSQITFGQGSTAAYPGASSVAAVYVESGWSYDLTQGNDLALIQLSTPISSVTPATLYTSSLGTELAQTATIVGYGTTGTGLTGNTGAYGTRRAIQNVVDAFGGDITTGGPPSFKQTSFANYSSNYMLTDFDQPNNASVSVMGGTTPLALEGASTQGDSGGGLFLTEGSATYLAGVTDSVGGPSTGSGSTLVDGYYGDYNLYTRVDVSSSMNFIDSALDTTLTWNNAGAGSPTNGQTWDTTNNNWNNGIGAAAYATGAQVTFNDTNNNHYAVTLNTTVSPGSVTVNNSSNNYSITGTGKIVDAGAFLKSGSDTLTLGAALTAGSVTISNGTVKLATNLTLGSGAVTSNVNLTSLSISGAGVLDVNNNHIIIDYSTSDPISTIAGYIKSGYNGGHWNGPGIMSTAARTTTNGLSYGLGYADGVDGTVSGLSSGQIEVKYTLLGDANLDSLVNAADFTILAANFNQPVTGWDQGDFNYDGLVNAADFTDLAANFNQSVSGAASGGDVAALDAFAAANGISLANVPEPGSLSLLVFGSVGTLARRRRHKRS